MRCSACGVIGTLEDNFCRRCGAAQRNSRLPARRPTSKPVLWRRASPAVFQGAALVALGLAAEWLLRSTLRGLARLPGAAIERAIAPKSKALTRVDEKGSAGAIAVSETVVMRRVILRR